MLVTGLAVLVVPNERGSVGVEVAAASSAALNPPDGRIVHAVSRSISTRRSMKTGKLAVSTSVDESWGSNGTVRDRHWDGPHRTTAYQSESETAHCGTLFYTPSSNMFELVSATDARVTAPGAFHGPVYGRDMHYLGKTSFHGIPAFKLAATAYSYYGYAADFTLIVRRDNYYPLRIVMRRLNWTVVTTYLTYGYIDRNARSEHLLHLAAHPGAFFLRYPGRTPGGKACKGFGDAQSLTGRGGKQ